MTRRVYPYLLVSLGLHLLLLLVLLLTAGPRPPLVRERRVVIEFSRREELPQRPEAGGEAADILAPGAEPLSGSLDLSGPSTLVAPAGRLPEEASPRQPYRSAGARVALPANGGASVSSPAPVPEPELRLAPPDLDEVLRQVPAPGKPAGQGIPAAKEAQGHGYLDSGALEWRGRERKVLKAARPEFPEVLLQEGQEVDVEATFKVAPNGQVTQVQILHSSGYSTVDRAVERALADYLFEASETGEEDIGKIRFRFRLERVN